MMMLDDNNDQEEYHLDDLDLLADEPHSPVDEQQTNAIDPSMAASAGSSESIDMTRMIRHGLIVVVGLVVLIICYAFIRSVISNQRASQPANIVPVAETSVKPMNVVPAPVMPVVSNEGAVSNQQLSALDQEQKTMNATMMSLSNQVSSLSTTVENMTTRMADLNTLMMNLNQKIELQSQEMQRLVRENRAKHAPKRHKAVVIPRVAYVVQAVIPGRAWLVSSSGATVTVREGSLLVGYGVVRQIDAQQGRVMTSSGRVIRFSQTDS